MRWFLSILVAIAMVVGIYKLKYPTYTYRYRMTVEVDAGGKTHSASSVIEVNHRSQPHILPEMLAYDSWARGQAVFLQLPGGKNIVALLASGAWGERTDYPVTLIRRIFNVSLENIQTLQGRRELSSDQMPTLITVVNPNDAKTAHVISPDLLDSSLGVHLRSISVEMTTDPTTPVDIDARLPFLLSEEKKRLDITDPSVFTPHISLFIRL
jgi:hypothetical protein